MNEVSFSKYQAFNFFILVLTLDKIWMKKIFFWNTWDKPYKVIYQLLLFVFVLSVMAYVFTYFSGSSFVINWEVNNVVNPVQTLFDSYRSGIFEFPIHINNYVISQGFIASELQVNEWPAYLLLIWLGIFISIILTLITDLPRFWFVASVVLLTVLFIGLKLDYLVLFNSYSKIGLGIAFVLYYPALYIFHFVKQDIGHVPRFLIHMGATLIFGVLIFYYSHVDLPFLHLVNYGIYVPLALTILFAFMVGHEIVSGFLRIITSGTLVGEKSGLIHFMIITVVFVLNAVMVLLRNNHRIDVDMYVIGSFWLLTIASIVGIWGYRTKEETYGSMFPFYPVGAILFISLAITAHLTISYFFISGNDFFVEVVDDLIIYSQIGFSGLFLVYVMANFFDMFWNNLDISKVLYKPMRMPYFTAKFAAVIVIMALFFKFNQIIYQQTFAGYYTGVADLYLKAEDYLSATEYYELSSMYSGTSHRANYALATMEKRNKEYDKEFNYLKMSVGKNPTEFAFVNLASKYLEQKRYFEAIFTLQDGLEKFPNDGNLMNNLGLAYMEIENIDSAFLYFQRSIHERNSENEAATNIYALLSLQELSIKVDTLEYLLRKSESLASKNNLVVLANNLKQHADDGAGVRFGDPESEKAEQLVYNYNKVLNDPALADSLYLKSMQIFYDSSNVSWFQDNLTLSAGLAMYQGGEVAKSFGVLNQIAIQNPTMEYYSLLGRLAFSQHAFGLAIDYFKSAFQNGRLEIAPELAFAYMENGELDKAGFIWKQIVYGGDSSNRNIAQKMIQVIETKDLNDILSSDMETRFSFLNYRYKEFDLEKQEGLVLSFVNEDIQALGFIRLFSSYLELGQHQKALALLDKVGMLNISKGDVLEAINLAQCQYAYHMKDGELMRNLYSNMISDDSKVESYLSLFKNMEGSPTNDKETLAINFEQIGARNPFFEPGVMEAVEFFNNTIGDPEKAYRILLSAVKTNPYSIELNKRYALQCLKVGLNSYAYDTKEELKAMMPSVMFMTFEKEFRQTMTKYDSISSDW